MPMHPPWPDPWAGEFAQEAERRRSIGQRGMLVAGTSSVTVGVLLQSVALFVTGTAAGFSTGPKATLLLALFCFVLAAVLGVLANVTGSDASKGVYGATDDDLTKSLTAARTENAKNTTTLVYGAALEVAGMLFVAFTALLFAL